jgi:hypothetical protein
MQVISDLETQIDIRGAMVTSAELMAAIREVVTQAVGFQPRHWTTADADADADALERLARMIREGHEKAEAKGDRHP